jgi:hypothetical protein
VIERALFRAAAGQTNSYHVCRESPVDDGFELSRPTIVSDRATRSQL